MPDDGRDPLICLRIPPPLNERLRAECDATGATLSEMVRDAIEQRLAPAAARALTPHARSGTKLNPRSPNGRCKHRVATGAYCRHCQAVVS